MYGMEIIILFSSNIQTHRSRVALQAYLFMITKQKRKTDINTNYRLEPLLNTDEKVINQYQKVESSSTLENNAS